MTDAFDHPIRRDAVLRCIDDLERVRPIVVVNTRRLDIDRRIYRYELTCGTNTEYYNYHQEDVDALFVDTGLTRESVKLVMDDAGRALLQQHCDHSFTEIHDSIEGEWVCVGEQCIHCRIRKDTVGRVVET